jgi:peptide/nickel transport system permease protein
VVVLDETRGAPDDRRSHLRPFRRITFALAQRLVFAAVLVLFVVSLAALPSGIERFSRTKPTKFDAGQYGGFWVQTVSQLAHGGLGRNNKGVAISAMVMPLYKRSIALLLLALGMGAVVGVALGVHGSRQARFRGGGASLVVALGLAGVPDFLLALLVMWGVSTAARHGVLLPILAPHHILAPALVLAVLPAGYFARLTTAAFDAAMKEDYIRTARAKGCSRGAVLRHCLRSVAGGLVAALPSQWALLLSNLIVVEYVLYWPGAGNGLLRAAFGTAIRSGPDPALCVGLALFLAVTYVVVDLTTTALQAALDPRLRGV